MILPLFYDTNDNSSNQKMNKIKKGYDENQGDMSKQLSRLIEGAYLNVLQKNFLIEERLGQFSINDMFSMIIQKDASGKEEITMGVLEILLQQAGFIRRDSNG